MIKWVIPDCDKLRQLNFWALRYFADHKDECTPNSKVFAAYGVLHDTILSGGRVTIKESRLGTENQIRTVLSLYQEYGVEYRLVFSNSLITPPIYLNPVNTSRTSTFLASAIILMRLVETIVLTIIPSLIFLL